jgi:nucleotide-binding universal stress UspA family protein
MTPTSARILLATSGSPAARHATGVAAELASAFNAELTVVHIVPAIEYRVGRLAPTLPIARRLDDPYASSVLLEARRIAWDKGSAARTVLIAGEPPQTIVALAARLHADLVVIGVKQRRGPARLLTRTGRWVRAHAPCPVLAVAAAQPSPPSAATEPVPAPASPQGDAAPCRSCNAGRCGCCGAFGCSVLVADKKA